MHATDRDQDLLLLQHGELSGWKAFWVRRHIQKCPHCQEKQAEYAQVSQLIAGAIRQDSALPSFAFRGETANAPKLASTTPIHFTVQPQGYRPAFVAAVSIVGAVIAAGAYAYKMVALQVPVDSGGITTTVFHARSEFSPMPAGTARDGRGKPTIFPYSTPNMHDDCPR